MVLVLSLQQSWHQTESVAFGCVAGPTFISLYAGAGGLDRGFINAGAVPLWANDFDADAVETYRQNLGDHIVGHDIQSAADELSGAQPDIIIGGPPCQGFSVAGRMRPDDPRSKHVWTFLEIVRDLQPRAFVMENVKNLAINSRWIGLMARLMAFSKEAGFTVRLLLLNASHYGVPQSRERMFLIGMRGTTPSQPPATTENAPVTVQHTLGGLPPFGSSGNDSICTARVTPARQPVLRRSPYAGMLFNGQGRPLKLDAPSPTLPASMGGNRTPIVDQLELEGLAEENWAIGYHRRLREGRRPNLRIPKRMRRLTVEEAAAIQTFPLTWEFVGRQSSRYRQIGNAVPPLLAQAVASQVIADMGNDVSVHGRNLAVAA